MGDMGLYRGVWCCKGVYGVVVYWGVYGVVRVCMGGMRVDGDLRGCVGRCKGYKVRVYGGLRGCLGRVRGCFEGV